MTAACAICGGVTWVRRVAWSAERACVRCWLWSARILGVPFWRWLSAEVGP